MCHGGSVPETWGGMSIRDLWEIQMEVIIDIRFGYSDTDTYKNETMPSLLTDKLGNHYHDQRKHFSPFFLSVDGMIGRYSLVMLSQLRQVMAEKR